MQCPLKQKQFSDRSCALHFFTLFLPQEKKNVVIKLLAAAKSHYSPPGRDSRQAQPAHTHKHTNPAEFNPSPTS